MKRMIALGLFVCLLPLRVMAGTAVLGFEIGVSTEEQVTATLSKKTTVSDGGTNKYTRGPTRMTDGKSYEIRGLNKVGYVFDDHRKLAAVFLFMDKDRFGNVFEALAEKYQPRNVRRPSVGEQYAEFKTPDSVIQLHAPHLSFEMEVRYIRNDTWEEFLKQSDEEEKAHRKAESSKF